MAQAGVEKRPGPPVASQGHHRHIAGLLSLLFMGLGQFYNRRFVKGIVFSTLELGILLVFGRRFLRAFEGLITLGRVPGQDHSLILLLHGLIAVAFGVLAIFLFVVNITDAVRDGTRIDLGKNVGAGTGFRTTWRKARQNSVPIIMIAPSVVLLAVVVLLPLAFAILLAFTNYDLYHVPPGRLVQWVGLENFRDLFSVASWKNTMLATLSWSITWSVMSALGSFSLGFLLAVLLGNPRLRGKNVFRTILILPWAVPGFVLLLGFTGFFNPTFGPVNKILAVIGISAIPWGTNVFWTRIMVLAANIYIGFPFWMVLCSGVMQGIGPDLYEAAKVDGATGWHQFQRITCPLVMYSVSPLLIMSLANAFYNFSGIYLLSSGGPPISGLRGAGGTDTMISWMFKITFDTIYKYNYASVISLLLFAIIVSLSIWNFRRTRQFKEEGILG